MCQSKKIIISFCWFMVVVLANCYKVNCEKPTDDYVESAKMECFQSKRIISCFRYKAARYLWTIANGQMNLFEQDTSRSIQGDDEKKPAISNFHFVQLTEPSKEIIFPEARQVPGDTRVTKLWKFIIRSISTFFNNHGFTFGINDQIGARVFELDAANETRESRAPRKKKWQVIVPLAILGKLIHIKLMLSQILFGLGAVQIILIGGGIFLYHYLKHSGFCKIEPHLIHSHSHVTDGYMPPEISHSASYSYPSYPSYPSYGADSVASPYSAGSYSKGWDRTYNSKQSQQHPQQQFNILDEIRTL